ncbi:MAG TPA: hypothetical protein VN026_18555 [Bacteroidia bacterium]|jgi:hypothetical protein|nr:hypothetical protein [Bacteroidia bacterium]
MESEKTLTERIMAITAVIQENYPELAGFPSEMTLTNPNEKDPDVNLKKLQEYYDELVEMVKRYKIHHNIQENANSKDRELVGKIK